MDKDKIFSEPRQDLVDFVFDESVAKVFSDMIRRSVPGYETIVSLIGSIAEKYSQPDTNIYDLGCSLGASTLSMHSRIPHSNVRYIAVDNSAAMLGKCKSNIEGVVPTGQFEIRNRNVEDVEINNASVVVMNFTLQFIEPKLRDQVVNQIYSGMQSGGVFILSEKLLQQTQDEEIHDLLHDRFKLSNGYSELEISQKRTALENVMELETRNEHEKRLTDAGFSVVSQWFQSFNFASFIAIK